MNRQYDKGRIDIKRRVGDLVLVSLTDAERAKFVSRKLAPRWSRPVKVTKILKNGVTYEVQKKDGTRAKLHITRLLPLRAST